MNHENLDLLSLQDEIISSFRPIELLFKVMDSVSFETHGELSQSYSEIGIALCNNFRLKLDELVNRADKN
jgi:hypothetical protein